MANRDHPEYNAWKKMRDRCQNPKADNWKYYGARGIKVCKAWESFEQFLADMGPRPSPQHTIERENVKHGYTPKNCRWATQAEQSRNKSSTKWIEHNGERMCATDFAKLIGYSKGSVHRKIKYGLTKDEIIATKLRHDLRQQAGKSQLALCLESCTGFLSGTK